MNLAAVQELIDNELDYSEGSDYVAIIGENPSTTARSPKLWDAACNALGIPVRMLPLDVGGANLRPLMRVLANDGHFLGGSIAVPHKAAVLDSPDVAAGDREYEIGVVNNLWRGPEGALLASNTDGEGALASIEEHFGPVGEHRIVQLGLGGAGRAVAATVHDAQQGAGTLVAATRSPHGAKVAEMLAIEWLPLDEVDEVLAEATLVVNCTSVGHDTQAGRSPLSEQQLDRLAGRCAVYDIVYNPRPTLLLELAAQRGLATLDGLEMNLLQAVIAFRNVFPAVDEDAVRETMAAVPN